MLHSFNPLGDRTPRRLSAATRELAARYLSGEIGSTLRPAPQAAGDEPYPVQLRRLAAEAETALSPDERLAGAARWLEATFHRFPGTDRPSVSHVTADFRHAVTGGLAGLEADIAAGRRANPEGAPFYDELAACIGAMRLWVERYRAELAERLEESPFFPRIAAALKQVPSCEFYPMEAVKTNVVGSDNVISACVANHVRKAIFLSTDKAAYPINAMGMTKAVMEKNVIARSRQMLAGDPVLCLTRYGNVMASRGSVIPLFCDQIDEGKPLTVTNPDMTRFMMTLEDAVDLVLYAFEHGEQGDLFVQKAPAVTIGTLAQAVLELKHADLGITTIGTRHGEKLFEVLVTAEEMLRAEDLPGFFRIPADNRNLNYDNYFSKGNPELGRIGAYTSHNTSRLCVEEMKQLLLKLRLFGGSC